MWKVSPEGDTNDDTWSVTNRKGGKGWCHRHDKFLRGRKQKYIGINIPRAVHQS